MKINLEDKRKKFFEKKEKKEKTHLSICCNTSGIDQIVQSFRFKSSRKTKLDLEGKQKIINIYLLIKRKKELT